MQAVPINTKVVSSNATLNNISVILYIVTVILLMEENGSSWENHRLAASHLQTLSHNTVSSIPRHKRDSN